MRLNIFLAATALATLPFLAACVDDNTRESAGARQESTATRMLMDRASVEVGMPAILNFTEKNFLKMLYELRDTSNLVTYSYWIDMQGNYHQVCPSTSIGFGMPFSAQFTAPSVDSRDVGTSGATTITTMQPEPNGLYMPDATSATWVICLGADGKTLEPVYVEPTIIVGLTPRQGAIK